MRRVASTLALAVFLLGCGAPFGAAPTGGAPTNALPSSRGEPVPLRIDEEMSDDLCCLLSFVVIDVVADPTFGTVNEGNDTPLTWPRGYTGRWAGSEVEVLDTTGKVVLTTGSRYWLSPLYDTGFTKFVVGMVKPCPDCELGGGPL